MADPREAFVGDAARLDSPLGPLDLGVVDARVPGIAEGVSRLLNRSIQDALSSRGGHLPDWLVRDIERNYISPEKVRTLWAATGHRFALVLDREIVGTIHIAKSDRMILTVDRNVLNVDEADHPGFKPLRHHHVVNISVRHELRRAHLGRRMVEGIVAHFRGLFEGEGLWVRADPPWHPGLSGLGFEHDPTFDVFLPPDVERTSGLPHDVFNDRYACACAPKRAELATHKLQYVSMTRPFTRVAVSTPSARVPALEPPTEAYAQDEGHTIVQVPRAVVRPATIDELAATLAWATREKRRVTIRGQGQSHAGQALGEDVVVSTERLDRLVAASDTHVTVEGGCTWRGLAERSPRLPPVIPTMVDASIGGTLSSVGIGIGGLKNGLAIDHVTSLLVVTGDGRKVECSRTQAGWLFDAALGGYGQFGVIARVTLPVAEPIGLQLCAAVRVDELATVLAAFDDAETLVARVRVSPTQLVLVRAYAGTRSLRTHVTESKRTTRIAKHVLLQVIVPRPALAPYLAHLHEQVGFSNADEEELWIHPFAERRDRPGLFVPRVGSADGELVFALTLMSNAGARAAAQLLARNHALVVEARRLGGAPTLQSGAPDLRAHLGDRHGAALTAKRLADPADVLGSPHVRWSPPESARP